MNEQLQNLILESTASDEASLTETIQSLWSGYGTLDRYALSGGDQASVIVKHVKLPKRSQHPRGWDTDISHQRKLRSYQVETAWYQYWAVACDDQCRVPKMFALQQSDGEFLIVLEDLDQSGFPVRCHHARWSEISACLKWLANFHATFMGKEAEHLWPVGTYWHLDTRPDELAVMEEGDLKCSAQTLDQLLTNAPFQTLVHGDAKLANFCFSDDGTYAAAVDFQYVGGGCGMKDVAYFISSCLDEEDCDRYEADLLEVYFSELHSALRTKQPTIDPVQVENAWRPLYAVAWTDFFRFLQGWSPGHWKVHRYSERLASEVLEKLKINTNIIR